MRNIKRRSLNFPQPEEQPIERNTDENGKKDLLATHMAILAMQNDQDKDVKVKTKIPLNESK